MTDTSTPVDHLARAKAELVDADNIYDFDGQERAFARKVAHVHALVAIAEALQPRPAPSKDHEQILRAAREWAALSGAARSDLLLALRHAAYLASKQPGEIAVIHAVINLLVAAQDESTPC